jgi:hypothetical protein
MLKQIIYGGVEMEEQRVERKKPIYEEDVLIINEYFRVKVTDASKNLDLLRKRKYDDKSEEFVDDGCFSRWNTLLFDVLTSMTTQNLIKSKRGQAKEIKDLAKAFEDAKKELYEYFNFKLEEKYK